MQAYEWLKDQSTISECKKNYKLKEFKLKLRAEMYGRGSVMNLWGVFMSVRKSNEEYLGYSEDKLNIF